VTRIFLQLSPAHHLAREGELRSACEVKLFCDLRGPPVQLHKCGPRSGALLFDSSL